MIGVITATTKEFEALNKVIGTNKTGTMTFTKGRFGKTQIVGVQAGVGKVNAALCAQKMIDYFHPEAIINVGVAGSLSPELKIGDIVISEDAVQHDFDITFFYTNRGLDFGFDSLEFKADPRLVKAAKEAAESLGIAHKVGRVVSGDLFVSEKEKKQELIDKFHGLCCEMEGGAIAQVCVVNRTPFVILRAISDSADEQAEGTYLDFASFAAEEAIKLITTMLEQKSN